MIPAEGTCRQAGRDADRRSCQRQQATARGQAPAPPASPVRPVRLQFSRGPIPDTAQAACASHDPELWFSDSPQDAAQAKAICHRCPERAPCLSGALRRRETYGIWGGTDVTAERQKKDVA
jgi:hypothetical protein